MPSIKHLCKQSVTIEPKTGADSYNKPTYGAGELFKSRVQWRRKELNRGATGAVGSSAVIEVSEAQIWIDGDPRVGGRAIGRGDRVTLPNGDVEGVLDVKPAIGGAGDTNHTKVFV